MFFYSLYMEEMENKYAVSIFLPKTNLHVIFQKGAKQGPLLLYAVPFSHLRHAARFGGL